MKTISQCSDITESWMQDQAKEFVRRAPLLGLGATQALQIHKQKRFIRPGESRDAKKDLVVYDAEGNIKHTKTASDKLVERIAKGPAVGKRMRIIAGRHAGLTCHVSTINSQVSRISSVVDLATLPALGYCPSRTYSCRDATLCLGSLTGFSII